TVDGTKMNTDITTDANSNYNLIQYNIVTKASPPIEVAGTGNVVFANQVSGGNGGIEGVNDTDDLVAWNGISSLINGLNITCSNPAHTFIGNTVYSSVSGISMASSCPNPTRVAGGALGYDASGTSHAESTAEVDLFGTSRLILRSVRVNPSVGIKTA